MKTAEDIFKEHGAFVSVANLTDYECRVLYAGVKEGIVTKIRNGVYASTDSLATTMVDIDKIIPGGILCLWSAWAVYNLTTQIPNAYYVAIEKKRKIILPTYPEFILSYQSENQLELGQTKMEIGGFNVKIFDKERSVCDAIKHRNKIGIDVMAEIVQTYLRGDNRNIDKLYRYARQLRVATSLKKYLELWQ